MGGMSVLIPSSFSLQLSTYTYSRTLELPKMQVQGIALGLVFYFFAPLFALASCVAMYVGLPF